MEVALRYPNFQPEETILRDDPDWENRMEALVRQGKVFAVEGWRSERHWPHTDYLLATYPYQCRPAAGPAAGMVFYPDFGN